MHVQVRDAHKKALDKALADLDALRLQVPVAPLEQLAKQPSLELLAKQPSLELLAKQERLQVGRARAHRAGRGGKWGASISHACMHACMRNG